MKLLRWRDWGIGGRLVVIAVVPATAMGGVLFAAPFFAGRDQIRTDIDERGGLLAAALAESSRYAIVSGNTAPLKDTLGRLVDVDQGLIGIEVLDKSRTPIVSVGDPASRFPDRRVFEAAV